MGRAACCYLQEVHYCRVDGFDASLSVPENKILQTAERSDWVQSLLQCMAYFY